MNVYEGCGLPAPDFFFFREKNTSLLLLKANCSNIGVTSLQSSTHAWNTKTHMHSKQNRYQLLPSLLQRVIWTQISDGLASDGLNSFSCMLPLHCCLSLVHGFLRLCLFKFFITFVCWLFRDLKVWCLWNLRSQKHILRCFWLLAFDSIRHLDLPKAN
jgi:hypothetical protein